MDIRKGTPVFTSDGERLGEVKEFRDTYFKVDANMQPDYWLSTACVRGGSAPDAITVDFVKDDLESYKQDLK